MNEYPSVKVAYDEWGSEAHIWFDNDGDLNIAEPDYRLTIPLTDDHLDQLIDLLKKEKRARREAAQVMALFNDPSMYDGDLFSFGGVQ